jgi:hypothetical protein
MPRKIHASNFWSFLKSEAADDLNNRGRGLFFACCDHRRIERLPFRKGATPAISENSPASRSESGFEE